MLIICQVSVTLLYDYIKVIFVRWYHTTSAIFYSLIANVRLIKYYQSSWFYSNGIYNRWMENFKSTRYLSNILYRFTVVKMGQFVTILIVKHW